MDTGHCCCVEHVQNFLTSIDCMRVLAGSLADSHHFEVCIIMIGFQLCSKNLTADAWPGPDGSHSQLCPAVDV
jgi:hypothetical protein